jgi:hypothetical protein
VAQYNTQGTGTLDGTAKFIVTGYQKMILNGKLHNTIPVGKPRTIWEDTVQRDALQIPRI